jgi:hypothetical protein
MKGNNVVGDGESHKPGFERARPPRLLTMNKDSEPSCQTISMTALRLKTREVIEKACYAQNIFIVKAYGRPMAAIIGIAQFEKLMALDTTGFLDDGGTDEPMEESRNTNKQC